MARPAIIGSATFNLEAVGTARSIPGKTFADGAIQIRHALKQAAEGHQVFSEVHQSGEWLRKSKIITAFDVGQKTVKYTKQQYPDNIEDDQGWLRWRS